MRLYPAPPRCLLLWTLLLGFVGAARGDSPGPTAPRGVHASLLEARVVVEEGLATTRLRLTLRNDGPRAEEAVWILPLPEGSVADELRMVVGGVEQAGAVLDGLQARQVYEGIVRARRDPALLEYLGRGCLRARVFPVPPQGELVVEVRYREILPVIGSLTRWSFPLAAAGLDASAPDAVVLELEAHSQLALHSAFSPTPGLEIVRTDDQRLHASYESFPGGAEVRELALFLGRSQAELGLDCASTGVSGTAGGAFALLVTPPCLRGEGPPIPRTVTFALDVSGSMEGEKLEQAKRALASFLSSLRAGDRFQIVPFSTEAEPFFPAPVERTTETVAEAGRRASELTARGGTNLGAALRASLLPHEPGSPDLPIVVLLSDGDPTVGERKPERILELFEVWNEAAQARVFVFGVGNDLNTQLLDSLADRGGGTRAYVRPGEDIELATSDLFTKLANPVLTDLELSIEGVRAKRLLPARLPNLFHGGRLVVLGLYEGSGACTVRLRGRRAGEQLEYVYRTELASQPVAAFDFLPQLWAERRVAFLLDQIRLHGAEDELVDEVRRLGVENGIVTPYTAHLIVERGLDLSRAPSGQAPAGSPQGSPRGTPATPGPRAPATPSGSPAPALEGIALRLREAGILPEDASPDALLELAREVAREVAREMQGADAALQRLASEHRGRQAVDDSTYLARILSSTSSGSDELFLGRGKSDTTPSALLARFTRRVHDKTFDLRQGVWIDRAIGKVGQAHIVVEAFSDAYFQLLARAPGLQPYFRFSSRLVVLHDGQIYELRSPPPGG